MENPLYKMWASDVFSFGPIFNIETTLIPPFGYKLTQAHISYHARLFNLKAKVILSFANVGLE